MIVALCVVFVFGCKTTSIRTWGEHSWTTYKIYLQTNRRIKHRKKVKNKVLTWWYVADGEEGRGRWFKSLFTVVFAFALVCWNSVQQEIEL